jgi:hypothetical protein
MTAILNISTPFFADKNHGLLCRELARRERRFHETGALLAKLCMLYETRLTATMDKLLYIYCSHNMLTVYSYIFSYIPCLSCCTLHKRTGLMLSRGEVESLPRIFIGL